MQKKCSNINKGIFWTLFPPIYFCGYSNIRKVSSRNLSNVWRFSRLTIYCKSSILKMRMEKYLIICDKSSSTCTYEVDIEIARNNHNLTFFGVWIFQRSVLTDPILDTFTLMQLNHKDFMAIISSGVIPENFAVAFFCSFANLKYFEQVSGLYLIEHFCVWYSNIRTWDHNSLW